MMMNMMMINMMMIMMLRMIFMMLTTTTMMMMIPLLMTGLLPVRMSMSSIASIDAIGARPLTICTIILEEDFVLESELFAMSSLSLNPQISTDIVGE